MGFSDRAVMLLERSLGKGVVDESRVRNVLRCDEANVSSIVPYLEDELDEIRKAAARVVAAKGDPNIVIDRVPKEESMEVVHTMLRALGKRGEGELDRLAYLLKEDEGSTVRMETMNMFREAGREDCLMPLLFSRSESEVDMTKRCLNEQERRRDTKGTDT